MAGPPTPRIVPELLFAAVPVLVVTALAAAWTLDDHSPPHDDDWSLYRSAVCMADRPFEGTTRCGGGAPYPPLVPLVAGLLLGLVGDRSLDTAMLSLLPWYVVLAASLYAGARVRDGRFAAMAASFTGPALWLLAGLRHAFYTELALAATAALTLAALVHSDGLRRPVPALLAGLGVGLGMLTKWSFAFFVAPPVAVWVAAALWRAPRLRAHGAALALLVLGAAALAGAAALGRGSVESLAVVAVGLAGAGLVAAAALPRYLREDGLARVRGVALLLGVGGGIAAPWYIAMRGFLAEFLTSNLDAEYAGDPMGLWTSWPFYPAVLVGTLGVPLLVGVGIGAGRSVLRGRNPFVLACLGAALGGVLILAVLPYRSARYASPALPLLAPALAILGAGPRALHVWRAVVVAWALLFQSLGLIRPPALGPLRFGDPQALHLGGNTRTGISTAWRLLRHPPLGVRTQGDIPFDGFGVEEMVDEIERRGGGPVVLLVPVGVPELRLPFSAELLRRGRAPESFRFVVVRDGSGDPATGQDLSGGPVYFAEVLEAEANGRLPNDRAPAMAGTWEKVWEREDQRRTRHLERLWVRR